METLDLSLQEKHTIKVIIVHHRPPVRHRPPLCYPKAIMLSSTIVRRHRPPSSDAIVHHRPPSSAFRAFPIEFRGRWTKVKMLFFVPYGGGRNKALQKT